MQPKCLTCINHRQTGKRHTCPHCRRIVYGELLDPLIDQCPHYVITDSEKARREYYEAILNLPIHDNERKPNTPPKPLKRVR